MPTTYYTISLSNSCRSVYHQNLVHHLPWYFCASLLFYLFRRVLRSYTEGNSWHWSLWLSDILYSVPSKINSAPYRTSLLPMHVFCPLVGLSCERLGPPVRLPGGYRGIQVLLYSIVRAVRLSLKLQLSATLHCGRMPGVRGAQEAADRVFFSCRSCCTKDAIQISLTCDCFATCLLLCSDGSSANAADACYYIYPTSYVAARKVPTWIWHRNTLLNEMELEDVLDCLLTVIRGTQSGVTRIHFVRLRSRVGKSHLLIPSFAGVYSVISRSMSLDWIILVYIYSL